MNSTLRKKIFCVLTILFFVHASDFAQADKKISDTPRFKNEIDNFQTWDAKNSFPKNAILFVGSSTIRIWESHDSFPDFPVINRGFGGSYISDVEFYYDQVIRKYAPSIIVFYAGDNDLAAGKSVEEVFADYTNLVTRVAHDLPKTKFIFLAIKSSSSRLKFWSKMEDMNARVAAYDKQNKNLFYVDTATPLLGRDGKPDDSLFRADHLHLNPAGYAIWNHILQPKLKSLYKK